MARPRKDLTPELESVILAGFRGGHYHESVALQAHISASHLYDLMNENPKFMERVKEASAEAERMVLAELLTAKQGAGENAWQARAWFLERRYEHWRSPDTKLREKDLELRRAEAANAAPAPEASGLTLAQIERELAFRRGAVQVIEATPPNKRSEIDQRLLKEYREPGPETEDDHDDEK